MTDDQILISKKANAFLWSSGLLLKMSKPICHPDLTLTFRFATWGILLCKWTLDIGSGRKSWDADSPTVVVISRRLGCLKTGGRLGERGQKIMKLKCLDPVRQAVYSHMICHVSNWMISRVLNFCVRDNWHIIVMSCAPCKHGSPMEHLSFRCFIVHVPFIRLDCVFCSLWQPVDWFLFHSSMAANQAYIWCCSMKKDNCFQEKLTNCCNLSI